MRGFIRRLRRAGENGERRERVALRLVGAGLLLLPLAGPALDAACGWRRADPAAALVMTPTILKEGLEALRGETCGDGRH